MFYSEPSEEPSRIERMLNGLNVLNKMTGRSSTNDLFFVMKCWNDNLVSYTYDPDTNNIVKNWVSLEPKDRTRHESNGNSSLRNPLSWEEESIFGCKVDVIEGNRFIVTMNLKQMLDRTNELILDENDVPSIIGMVDGKICKLKYAYAQMKNTLLPEVDYLNLYGESLETGKQCVEKIYEVKNN